MIGWLCGINNDTIQNRLLSEAKLTYKKAMDLAQGLESAAKNAKELKPLASVTPLETVHKVTTTDKDGSVTCHRCGEKGHKAPSCRFKNAKCHHCGKVGHLKKVCRSKGKPAQEKRQPVHCLEEEEYEEGEEYQVLHLGSGTNSPPVRIDLLVNAQPVCMEVDTGVAPSIVSESTFHELWPSAKLSPSAVRLRTYSGEALTVLGTVDVHVQYKEQTAKLPLLVVQGKGPSLFGRNWLQQFHLDWQEIHQLRESSLLAVLDRHADVFKEELGTLSGFKAKILVDSEAQPRFCKARTVPYAVKEKVEEELTRLTDEGILEPVQFSDWASPIVPVLKSDKSSVRICGELES